LQQCIQNELVLKKIHRGAQFLQKPWIKNYIDLNTLHRQNAKNKFEKDFFKLMNNSVYGKTMEDPERRVVSTREAYFKNPIFIVPIKLMIIFAMKRLSVLLN